MVLLDSGLEQAIEAEVALEPAELTGWRVVPGVQPMAVVAELMQAEELLRTHPEFQAALARRGVTDSGHDPGRRLAGRPLRPGRGVAAAAGPRRRLRAAQAGRQRVGAPGGRCDRAGRSEHAGGAAGGGPRGGAGAARERQLRHRGGRGAARRHRAARNQPARRTWIHGRGKAGALAALATARRLHAARGTGAEPVSATRTAAGCARSCTGRRCRRCACPTAIPAPRTTSRTRSTPARTGSACRPRRSPAAATAWARSSTWMRW